MSEDATRAGATLPEIDQRVALIERLMPGLITRDEFGTVMGNFYERLEQIEDGLERNTELSRKAATSADLVAAQTIEIRTLTTEIRAASPLAKRLWRWGAWLLGTLAAGLMTLWAATGVPPPQWLHAIVARLAP